MSNNYVPYCLLFAFLVLNSCSNSRSVNHGRNDSDSTVNQSQIRQNDITLEGLLKQLNHPYEIQNKGDTTIVSYSDQFSGTSYIFINNLLDIIIYDDSPTAFGLGEDITGEDFGGYTFSYNAVDVKPSFQGDTSLESFHKWVDENLYYKEDNPNATGTVILIFDIMPDGTVSNVIVLSGGDKLGLVSREVALNSPKWTPGEKNGIKCTTRISGFKI
ncbi:MAG: hypothetical protein J5495_01845 [Bacteroidales bacterium]|nr:hypothetical protein [Bacteroidales bacterium]